MLEFRFVNTETNIFRIANLAELSAEYRLYRVKGLSEGQEDYYRNLTSLANKLSRQLHSPVTFLHRDGAAYLVIREDAHEVEMEHPVIGRTAYLEKGSDVLPVNFSNLGEQGMSIALRFLQFSIQGSLRSDYGLWQPGSGRSFYEKKSQAVGNGAALHRGFLVRATALNDGGIGLCVDMQHTFLSAKPLPTNLSKRDFARYKASHTIYKFGHNWFEIQLAEWSELTVTEEKISDDGKRVNVLEYLHAHCGTPLPPEVVRLSKDCSVVFYYNARDEIRAAPSALCYPVLDPADRAIRRERRMTILDPDDRRPQIKRCVKHYLSCLVFGSTPLRLAENAERIPTRTFNIPDLRFGSNTTLSVRGTSGAIPTTMANLGTDRLGLLRDKSVGFFIQSPLQEQFFFMPETIRQSWGPQFMSQLCQMVNSLYPQELGYNPKLVPYDDRTGSAFFHQALAIKAAAELHHVRSGFAVVMVHDPSDRLKRHHDELAACAIQTLYKDFDVRAAVIHTEVGSECYCLRSAGSGTPEYSLAPGKRGKFDGYLRGVALNKVLLTNEKWPFVIADAMHADLTIGVDVKTNYVGFTSIAKGGEYIDSRFASCRFAEQIQADEFRKLLIEAAVGYSKKTGEFARSIALYRDGRMFEPEQIGARQAMDFLISEGYVAHGATLTCLEIPKRSFTPLRLFEVGFDRANRRPHSSNPPVGRYYIANDSEGYVCSTGSPFDRQGTVNPLHVRKVFGPLLIADCLQDIYWFTVLAWTRPEDCTRYPINIKINDRRLFEDAATYDEHELQSHDEETRR
jgi:hypothetical protein